MIAVLMLLEYKGNDPQVITGEVTKTRSPFNLRRKLFVDTRDAVYLLGDDFDSN